MTQVRPPGVYQEALERRHTPITLVKSGVVGFIGIAERGPTNEPVKITGIPQFYETFGDLPEGGYLAPAVEAFFKNGGKECRIVRVAHHTGRSFGAFAARSQLRLADRAGQPTLLVSAHSEGQWGNQVLVSAGLQATRAQTFLTLDAREGDVEVTIRSTHGFRPGTLLRIYNEGQEHYRMLIDVTGKSLRWAASQPLPAPMLASAPTYVESVEFEMAIVTSFARERFADLSMDPASPAFVERIVNDRSRLVTVKALPSTSTAPDIYPANVTDIRLSGGQDGLHNLTPDDFIGMSAGPSDRTGMAVLELVDEVDLLAAPDVVWLFQQNAGREGMPFSTLKDVEVVHDAMISQCERLNDRYAIIDSPFPESTDRTREYRLGFDTAYGSLYFPWVKTFHKGRLVAIPPSGHVAGVIARCDAERGVHHPPANEAMEDVQDVALALRDEDVGYLNAEGINCIKYLNARGIRIWGARTMSSDSEWRYLNVRRIMNAINKSMSLNLQWVVFEPNLPSLWKAVSRNVTQFMMDLWRRGWFTGSVPEESFFVKCDDETNPPEERAAGRLIVEVGVAPVRPAEFLTLRLAQEMQAEESG